MLLASPVLALAPYRAEGDAIPAPLTADPGDPAKGRAVVVNRQAGLCLLCHTGPFPEDPLQGSIGPSLAGVADRLNAGQIRLRLVDPSRLNPDTVMPDYYVVEGRHRVGRQWQGKPVLSAAQIEDVVAFLATLHAP